MIKIVSSSSLHRPSLSRCIWTVRNLYKSKMDLPTNRRSCLLGRREICKDTYQKLHLIKQYHELPISLAFLISLGKELVHS